MSPRWLERRLSDLPTDRAVDCNGNPINFYEPAVKPARSDMPSWVRYENITRDEARAIYMRAA